MLIRDVTRSLEPRHPVIDEMVLTFGAWSVRVQSSCEELLRRLREYYHPYLGLAGDATVTVKVIECDPPAFDAEFVPRAREQADRKIKEEYLDLADGRVVRKRLTGVVLMFGGELHVAAGPCRANLNQVINFINSRYIEWLLGQGGMILHAAAVADGDHGIALSGFSSAGKSTLALHLMGQGYAFVSNDRLVVRRERCKLRMFGLPKLPRVNPGTIIHNPRLHGLISESDRRRYEAMTAEELWQLEKKHDVFIDRCFDQGVQRLSARMKALVVLCWRHGGGAARIERVDLSAREDLWPVFRKSVGLFHDPAKGCPSSYAFRDYVALVGDCPVVEVSGGVDFERAVDACRELLGS